MNSAAQSKELVCSHGDAAWKPSPEQLVLRNSLHSDGAPETGECKYGNKVLTLCLTFPALEYGSGSLRPEYSTRLHAILCEN